ncbi:MAG TPA: flagellar motor switch protein FliM [Firmicutes bacterium]|nr:flagellar motor switch protein FliM [Candidatus Fermentithermobacillaceae bacterium]
MALTQQEIDELINSMLKKTEEEHKPQVIKPRLRVYDFKRPDKFSKDHLRGAQLLFDNFARLLTSYFSGLFRLAIHANVSSVDQITYEEFAKGVGNPCSVAVIEWKTLPSNVLVSFSPKLALPMVDRLCGGPGNASAVSRGLTEIEAAVLRKVAQTMTDIFSDTLRDFNIEKHDLVVSALEVNPLFVQQAMAPNDIVLSVILSLRFGSISGNIEFCLPYVLLEPILPALSAQRWFSRRDTVGSTADRPSVETALEDIEVPVSCRLGEASLSMGELMSLKPGDVLELDATRDDYATLYILGKPKFKVKVGRVGNRLAAQIVGIVDGGKEEVS